MKRRTLISALLVLAMTSWAGAAYLQVDPCDAKPYYLPNDVITIQLMDYGSVLGMAIDSITDNPGGVRMGAASNDIFNPGFQVSRYAPAPVGGLNAGGQLVAYMWAVVINFPPTPVSGILYSFDYVVPNVMSDITITTYNDGGDNWYAAELDYTDGSSYVAPPELSVTIHVVPEPATLVLLGLGGLLLRRRK